jgi:hypothetical protein
LGIGVGTAKGTKGTTPIYRRNPETVSRPPVAGRCLPHVRDDFFTGTQEANMWWYFGIGVVIIVAAAYVVSRPRRRTTIVLERD